MAKIYTLTGCLLGQLHARRGDIKFTVYCSSDEQESLEKGLVGEFGRQDTTFTIKIEDKAPNES